MQGSEADEKKKATLSTASLGELSQDIIDKKRQYFLKDERRCGSLQVEQPRPILEISALSGFRNGAGAYFLAPIAILVGTLYYCCLYLLSHPLPVQE